ncbi:MAG: tRNA pseudouridine(38-40) synthase TruA [Proteobacteria bacterium]|nr:tRNA pseudouridine(38-40) synthase TruA [Pseudomonadota bacterium]
MRNLKIIVEYDGTGYHGWQRQPHDITIQQTLEEKFGIITQEEIKLIGSGRTDAGVHAAGQVANFRTETRIGERNLLMGANSLLPGDVVIKDLTEVDEGFHARYDAKSKVYLYQILNSPFPSALYRNYSWFINSLLDIDMIRTAALQLIGTHDFSSFCAANSDTVNHVREVMDVNVRREDGGMIKFFIEADGFLRHMVRNIVGTLVDVGRGKLSTSGFLDIMESRDRKMAGITAPPQGLFLIEVKY